MSDLESTDWSEIAANNIQPAPAGWPSLSSPNIVYSTDREMMGAIKRDFNRRNATVTSGGSANAQTLTYTQGPTVYVRGQQFTFIAGFGNTGPLTVAVGGLAATAVQSQGVALTGGEIKAGQIVELMFDGTQFQIISGQGTFMPVSGPGLAGGTTGGLYNDVGRNKLHNAMFRIQQRGTGPWTTNTYSVDRWQVGTSLDTISFSVVAASDTTRSQIGDEAATYVLQNSFTGNAGAASYNLMTQNIESVRTLGGKTVTLSFYAVAGSAGLKLGLNGYHNYGTGGSPSAAAAFLATGLSVNLATTWARYSVQFAVPSNAGKTLGTNGNDSTVIQIFFSSGATTGPSAGNIGVQSGLVQLWGMQLEIGSVATPLEKIDIAVDRTECQRFFQTLPFVFNGYTAAGGSVSIAFPLPVRMRAAPAYTPTFTVQSNCSGSVVQDISSFPGAVYQIATTGTALGAVQLQGNFTASADL